MSCLKEDYKSLICSILCLQINGLNSITTAAVTIQGNSAAAAGRLTFEDTPNPGSSALRWSIQPKADVALGLGYGALVFAADTSSLAGQDSQAVQAFIKSKGLVAGKANGEVVTDAVSDGK